MANLWDKDKTQCDGCTEDNEETDDNERGCWLVVDEKGHGGTANACDYHIIDAHADVLGVVQCRNGHLTRLPSEETTEHLHTKVDLKLRIILIRLSCFRRNYQDLLTNMKLL